MASEPAGTPEGHLFCGTCGSSLLPLERVLRDDIMANVSFLLPTRPLADSSFVSWFRAGNRAF